MINVDPRVVAKYPKETFGTRSNDYTYCTLYNFIMAQKRVLPRGVTEMTLNGFFEHVEGILGKENVSRDNTTGALEGLGGEHAYIDPFPTGHV
jgi:hypothetical protein